MKNLSGLYINIPFCNKICPFCSFAVIRDDPKKHSPYINLIFKEFHLISQNLGQSDSPLQSVYFGGGTPSRLSPGLLASLVDWIHKIFPLSTKAQWSIEVNPEDISESYAQEIKQLGFSRVSIGVQSFLSQGLQQLGRIHHPHQSRNAIKHLQTAGFEDINLDLMFGYPGQTAEKLMIDLNEFIQWNPSHISIYGLTIEEKTNFARKPALKIWQVENEFLISQLYESIVHFLSQHQLIQYEISNFAKPDFESRQNTIYWSGENYLGLGLGAHSLISPYRWGNHRRWIDYRQSLEKNSLPIQEKEKIGPEEAMNEELMIHLRLAKGLNLGTFSLKYQLDLDERWHNKLHDLMKSNLVTVQNDQLQLTIPGQLLADEITSSLAALLP